MNGGDLNLRNVGETGDKSSATLATSYLLLGLGSVRVNGEQKPSASHFLLEPPYSPSE